MITTAVQPASQVVEIQGAPPTAPDSGDAFRVTFAASMSDATAKNAAATVKYSVAMGCVSGADSGKKAQAGESLAKGLSASVAGVRQSFARSNKVPSEVALKTVGAVSSSDRDLVEDGPVTIVSKANTPADALSVTSLSVEKLPVPAVDTAGEKDGFDSKVVNPRAKYLTVKVAAIGPVVSLVVSSYPAATRPGGDAALRSRKEEVSVAGKDVAPAQSNAIDQKSVSLRFHAASAELLADTSPHLETRSSVPPVAHSVAELGTVGQMVAQQPIYSSISLAGYIGPVADATHLAKSESGEVSPTATALRAFAPVQPNVAESLKEPPLLASRENISVNTSASIAIGNAVGAVAEAAVATATPDDQKVAFSHPSAAEETSTAASSQTISAPGLPAVPNGFESVVTLQPAAAGSGIAPAESDDATKAGTFIDRPDTSPVFEAKSIAPKQSVRISQPAVALTFTTSKAAGTVGQPTSDPGTESFSGGPAVEVAGIAQHLTAHVPPLDTGSDGVSRSVPPSETQADPVSGSPPVNRAVAASSGLKDAKPKPQANVTAEVGADRQVLFAQGFAVGMSNIVVSNPSVAINAVPGGSTTVTGVVTPLSHATTAEALAPSSHLSGISASSLGIARALSQADGSSVSESNATTSQLGESHRILLATPTALEVGVQSGTQGWLRIRAEVSGQGEVNTSLAATSSLGRQMLHRQMPALNAFLHSEQITATATVVDRVVSAPGGLQGDTAMDSGGLGSQSGAGGSNGSLPPGTGAQSDRGEREAPQPLMVSEVPGSYDTHSGTSESAGLPSGRGAIFEESGRWLNVRV